MSDGLGPDRKVFVSAVRRHRCFSLWEWQCWRSLNVSKGSNAQSLPWLRTAEHDLFKRVQALIKKARRGVLAS